VGSVSLLDNGGLNKTNLLRSPTGFYESYSARNVGDVVNVRIIEAIDVLKRKDVRLVRDNNLNANFNANINAATTDSAAPEGNTVTTMSNSFSFPGAYKRTANNVINVDNNETFTTVISALITEIDEASGNMVVEGNRQIVVEGQTKSLYVRGIMHPKDLDANNEVPSYKLANAQIQVMGEGKLDEERNGGFLYKIFKFLI
jgi:flagellar L-ring protein precursor FlgH